MTATEHMFAADTSARPARSSLRSPGRLLLVHRLAAHVPVFRRVQWLRRVVSVSGAAKNHRFRRKHSAHTKHASAAASARPFCRVRVTQAPLISSSAVSFVSQRLWATSTRTYPRKEARTACWPPNSAAAPDRAPLLGPAAEPPRAYWLACVREQCTLWRPAG